MSLSAGTRLGPYEIDGLIGAGGMGEVYRAVDTRLGRAVAIKMLPRDLADDPDRMRRFAQEARAAAVLNHPAILAVYDIGVYDEAPFIVTELLEGQTLRDVLNGGRLPLAICVDYGRQMAEGLACAHEQGIVHRDLKPENVFVLQGDRIKILDFGLARLTSPNTLGTIAAPGETCETPPQTKAFTILGTLGYMAPEQARGETADHRADIFAFGCVLYEMLEGKRAFTGATPADTISAILKDTPPDLTSSPERPLPPAVQRTVERCLQKQPDRRFQSARDLAFVLSSLTGVEALTRSGSAPTSGSASASASAAHADHARHTSARRRWRGIAAASVLLAVPGVFSLVTMLAMRTGPRPGLADTRPTEFLVPTPLAESVFAPMGLPGLVPTAPQVGVSPDGRSMAFVASSGDGGRTLWVRSLDSGTPRAIDGTSGVNSWPFWSSDSRFVIVAIDRSLRRIDAVTGASERLCALPPETPPAPFVTGSWRTAGTVDTILFSIGGAAGIYRVPAAGGEPRAITKLDAKRGDNYHSWPQLLDDGRFLTFVRTNDPKTTGTYVGRADDPASASASGSAPALTLVQANPSRAVLASGHLLWVDDDRLMAQPIDASSLRLTGQPVAVAPSVFLGNGRTSAFWVSDNGMLVYAAGGSAGRQFRWLDRAGKVLGDVGPPGQYASFDLSPDGGRLVTEILKPGSSGSPWRSTLSTLDTQRGVLTPLTSGERNDTDPRFGPNGDVVFARNSGEPTGIVRSDPAGGQPSLLFSRGKLPVLWMEAWSRDGRALVYRSGADPDAWQVPSAPDPLAAPQRLTRASGSIEQVQLSPDNRWIAYNAEESGRYEVYVSPVPYNGKRWQVSTEGGVQATWKADGRELYYLGLDGALYVVDVRAGADRIDLTAPRRLFRSGVPVISAVVEQYRPTADGERFLFCLPLTSVQRDPLRVLLNWPARLSRRE